MLGDWLEESGWTSALVQADIAGTETADSFIKASHTMKTRHAHQVTAASLRVILERAYSEYTSQSDEDMSLEQWCVVQV